jgi:hypothetical protein
LATTTGYGYLISAGYGLAFQENNAEMLPHANASDLYSNAPGFQWLIAVCCPITMIECGDLSDRLPGISMPSNIYFYEIILSR